MSGLLLTIAGAHTLLQVPASAGTWIWFLALFIAGMPHGAYDLAVLARTSPTKRSVALRFTIYSAVMLGCLVAFVILPTPTVVAFLFLAAHHFGVSDSVWTRGRTDLAVSDHLAGLGRGLIVIFSPFITQPAAACDPFHSIAAIVQTTGQADLKPVALGAAVLVAAGPGLLVLQSFRARHAGKAKLLEEWSTIAAVLVLSTVASPLLSIGVYFLFVHASGHCLRAITPGHPVHRQGHLHSPGHSLANALRVHIESLPLLVPSILIVIIAAPLLGTPAVNTLALSFLAFCVIATLPHHILWLAPNRWLKPSQSPPPAPNGSL